MIDIEISSCAAYPCFTYNLQATRGGLKGSTTSIEWKYFKPAEAPKQKLIADAPRQPRRTPAYCREQLTWHTGSWEVPKSESDLFNSMAAVFYRMLHKTLTAGAPLEITPQQVRRQIAVIEECHRLNPQIYAQRRR